MQNGIKINTTRAGLLRHAQDELRKAGIAEAKEESERILEDVLGIEKAGLYIDPEKEVPREAEKRFLKILKERRKRIPLAYLLGTADFWQERLLVNKHCLIPRPETEVLVEKVIVAMKGRNPLFSFLDIGTGSGAIAIALLRACEHAHGTLLDRSGKALDVAGRNIRKYGLEDRARLVKGDLFKPFHDGEKWDVIVSNPPYLSRLDFLMVEPELEAEPKAALDGGRDGLEFYRRIVPAAKKRLNPGGLLAFELGMGQAELVSKWLQEAGYDSIQRFKDYSGIDRVLLAGFYPK